MSQFFYTHTHTHTHTLHWICSSNTLPRVIYRSKANPTLFVPSAAMARGPKKPLKCVAAPKHWMLDKLTGVFAPRPSTGPHKLRECLPLITFLRNRLKYALTGDEVKKMCMQRFIKIDGKVRTDITYRLVL